MEGKGNNHFDDFIQSINKLKEASSDFLMVSETLKVEINRLINVLRYVPQKTYDPVSPVTDDLVILFENFNFRNMCSVIHHLANTSTDINTLKSIMSDIDMIKDNLINIPSDKSYGDKLKTSISNLDKLQANSTKLDGQDTYAQTHIENIDGVYTIVRDGIAFKDHVSFKVLSEYLSKYLASRVAYGEASKDVSNNLKELQKIHADYHTNGIIKQELVDLLLGATNGFESNEEIFNVEADGSISIQPNLNFIIDNGLGTWM